MDIQNTPVQSQRVLWENAETQRTPIALGDSQPPASPTGGSTDLSIPPSVTMQLKSAGAKPADAVPAKQPPQPASKMEVAALQLMLSNPDIQALMQRFGGTATKPSGSAVADSIVQRYGPELATQLNQLAAAQKAVQADYMKAQDQAFAKPLKDVIEAAAKGETVPGWRLVGGTFWEDPARWEFDPRVFTRDYAAGTSPEQKAFSALHGADALKKVTVGMGEAQEEKLSFAGQIFNQGHQRSGDEPVAMVAETVAGWVTSRLDPGRDRLDPSDPPKLYNNDAVWFDPERGWVTDPANVIIEQNWLDRALPIIIGLGMAYVGGMVFGPGALTASTATGGSALGSFAFNVFQGMWSSSSMQLITTGEVDFNSALRNGLTVSLSSAFDLSNLGNVMNQGGPLANLLGDGRELFSILQDAVGGKGSFGDLLLETIGNAAGQGILSQIRGGDFGDAFIQSVLNGVSGQITGFLSSQIDSNPRLGESERSMMRLLTSATGSALRNLDNGTDAATAAAAREFLNGVLNPPQTQKPTH